MLYSQKYCLVSFINSIESNTEFDMTEWPLHITLADVFEIDLLDANFEAKLEALFTSLHPVNASAGVQATLGTTEVILINKTKGLNALHTCIIDVLEENGARFNSPEFTREGFVPHCTIQNKNGLNTGDVVEVRNIALVDMLPNENWQRRRIVSIFELQDEA